MPPPPTNRCLRAFAFYALETLSPRDIHHPVGIFIRTATPCKMNWRTCCQLPRRKYTQKSTACQVGPTRCCGGSDQGMYGVSSHLCFTGDQVGAGYMRRMKRDCEEAAKDPYDWIVIMGGTNDLGWGQPPNVIFENLSRSIPAPTHGSTCSHCPSDRRPT